jgi:hypothetical protein
MNNMRIVILMAAAVVTLSGPGYGSIYFDGGTHNIDQVSEDHIWVRFGTTVNLLPGGSVTTIALAEDSHLEMTGGTVTDLVVAHSESEVTVSGGIAYHLGAIDSAMMTISGGQVGLIDLEGFSTLMLIGSDFAINGNPIGAGELHSLLGDSDEDEPLRTMTGTLASGENLNAQFRIWDSATITIVPEPATMVMLGIGGIVLRRRR